MTRTISACWTSQRSATDEQTSIRARGPERDDRIRRDPSRGKRVVTQVALELTLLLRTLALRVWREVAA
jgi:hypothetical protein